MNAQARMIGERIGRAMARDAMALKDAGETVNLGWTGLEDSDIDQIPDQMMDCLDDITDAARMVYLHLLES